MVIYHSYVSLPEGTSNLEIFGVGNGVTVSWSFDFMFEMCMILMDQNLAPLKMGCLLNI